MKLYQNQFINKDGRTMPFFFFFFFFAKIGDYDLGPTMLKYALVPYIVILYICMKSSQNRSVKSAGAWPRSAIGRAPDS